MNSHQPPLHRLLDLPAQVLPLPTVLRQEMETRFSRNFDDVCIRVGPQPGLINAEAFVCGSDIYIAPSAYAPETAAGRRLLIHEFTHVVQQRGLSGQGSSAGLRLLDDPQLEAEADSMANGQARPISVIPAGGERVIQCSILRRDNKQALHGAIEELVRQIPIKEAYSAETYADLLFEWMEAHPHVFSGEKLEFGDMKNQSAKIPVVIHSGERINWSMLDRNDKAWIKKTILKMAKKHRYGRDFTEISTRILNEDENQWVAWKTSDCVFTAILIVLGLRFVGKGSPVEDYELEVETDLAEQLVVPKKVVQDHVLVNLLEDRLGWARMKASDLETLNGVATTGRSYVVSYCENERTDFWHTVYGTCTGKAQWKWVDRQYERNFGTKRASLKGDLATEANAWQIDEGSALVAQLRRELDIATLKSTYSAHLE